MATTADNIFVNLPVKDLKKTMDFFSQVGFAFNAQFTDEKAACMVINENIYAMLLVEEFFQTFIKKEIADATRSTEVIVALSAKSREEVDQIADRALAAGGSFASEPVDHGFMYSRSFQDVDGHIWEIMYMDQSVIEQG
ncbi:VOC family protein [Brevibacillus sp. B_LB10_24]|uniref:VOC family protein n=1 Tax=Brevibacillus sp. B_LB10_24 TaxID=3380645 RepID=UPI0038B8DBCA